MRVVVEVDRDVGRFGVAEDALELLLGGALDRGVDLVRRGRALGDELEIDHRDVRRRHPDRDAVEPAGELRQHEADRLGGAGRGRDHVERRGARPIEVLVHLIERGLVVGVGVDRGHEALVDADRVVEHLGDRREAIGRARSVGDDGVRLGQLVVVDAVDDGEVDAVGRRRDQHALGAGGQMRRRLLLRGEDAGAFQRDVDAERLPRQLRRVLDRGDLDRAVAAI